MSAFRFGPVALALLLSACGSGDPTPEPDDSASAREINSAFEQARDVAAHAGLPDTPEGEEALARQMIAPADAPRASAAPANSAAEDDAKLAFATP